MTNHNLQLVVLTDLFAIYRLDKNAPVPESVSSGNFFSITRTSDETSVVCPQNLTPDGVRCERGWRCLRVSGTIDFTTIGVVASLVTPLAEMGISVFVVSTFDTDYMLLKDTDFEKGMAALRVWGHSIQ
jgi:hypothetical protein